MNRLDPKILPVETRETIGGWMDGAVSAPITLVKLIYSLREPVRVLSVLEPLLGQMLADSGSDAHRKATEMKLLLRAHPQAMEVLAELLRFERQQQHSEADQIANCARLFDCLVQKSEEASVALYSLGDPGLLRLATVEVINLLRTWNFLGDDRVILQIGCGVGRFEAALAGAVKMAYGIDISSEMIAAARRRCATQQNVRFMTCSGHNLDLFESAIFDGVYVIDTFPYLHAAGSGVVVKHFQEIARVLRPYGDFILMNFSYRNSLATDQQEIQDLAQQFGFEVLENGIRPFKIWDGAAWRLRGIEAFR